MISVYKILHIRMWIYILDNEYKVLRKYLKITGRLCFWYKWPIKKYLTSIEVDKILIYIYTFKCISIIFLWRTFEVACFESQWCLFFNLVDRQIKYFGIIFTLILFGLCISISYPFRVLVFQICGIGKLPRP